MPDQLVPFLDLGAAYRELAVEVDASYRRVMDSGWFLLGAELDHFEQEFASFSGATDAIGLASGLDALVLALRAMDVGPGHEVIVPSNTFIATWLAVTAVGATPVAVEPDPLTHVITADAVAASITPRTAAVIPVHLYGLPVDMEPLLAVARDHRLRVLSDAAQAHGATDRGRPLGGVGDAVAWSFYPGKNLGAFADAGAVTTDDVELARRIRRLRNYGSEEKYVNLEAGVNSRLDELQAAFLRDKLRVLDTWNGRRQAIADVYVDRLDGCDLILPHVPEGRTSAWHLFVVQSNDRDALQHHLGSCGVQTIIHYPIPPHRQQAYGSSELAGQEFPIADELAASVLSLPIGPHMSGEQVDHVVSSVKSFWA